MKSRSMRKNEMLEAIEAAKETHEQQMENIRKFVDGAEVASLTALNKMECEFGRWFYPNKEILTKTIGYQFFDRIDEAHERWHKEFSKISAVFQKYQEKQGGFFSKILKNKIDPLEQDKLKFYYAELSSITDELLRDLESATHRVSALPESKFK